MSIPVLNYASYTPVAGGADFFDKFRNFAVATCGWVEEQAQTDKIWDTSPPYGWKAGDEDYLAISSLGNGAQVMRFEFRRNPTIVSAITYDKFAVCPIRPANWAYALNATHPISQTNRCWQVMVGNDYTDVNMPNGSYEACHLFGNEKIIIVVNQYTTGVNVVWAIGSCDLYPELQARTDLWQHFYCHQHPADSAIYMCDVIPANLTWWFNGMARLSTDVGNGYNVWLESDRRIYDYVRYSIGTDRDNEPAGAFENLLYLVRYNTFSDKRTIIQPRVYYKGVSSGKYFPAGTLPFGYTKFSGLAIGEEIDVGGETFRVFPTILGSYTYGLAFRVA